MPITSQQLETTSLQNVRVVPVEPEVKSAGTSKLFKRGVSANAGSAKIADPSCYASPSATEDHMLGYEIVHDKVRIRDNANRQWLVWLNGKLRRECISEDAALEFVTTDQARAEDA